MQIYVNAKARCDGDGSKERPFKRINDAAKIAMPGDEVLVLPGVYREYVNPIHSGTAENRIVYRSVEPLGAIIQDIWVTHIPNGVFNDYNPYNTPVYGDWYFAKDERHTGCVYLNDKAMYEALTLTECDHAPVYEPSWEHEWTRYKWYAECERDETVIYANFQGKDPREERLRSMSAGSALCPVKSTWISSPCPAFILKKQLRPGHRRQLIRTAWWVRTGPMAGSLRTVKSSTANAVEFLLANIMMQKMIITLPVSM